MMAKKMVPLCKPARTSSTQEMVPQTEHPQTRVEGCQARARSAQSLFESLTHPPSLGSWPPPLLRDALVSIPGSVIVGAQLS